MVVRSNEGDSFNAIDPYRIDEPGGSWLVFGSWWDGIRLIPLDPASGLRLGNDPPIALASRQGKGVEAASILHHGDWYYLFTSFDRCCRGTGSTYKIAVGRAADIAGPYLDRDGVALLEGGGTIMLQSEGDRRGPGGQEAFMVGDEPWLVYHYYDRKMYGLSKLQIAPLHFDAEGWPFLDPAPAE
jgi:arabinan endo-1,5-alpha-L-arabinosidase